MKKKVSILIPLYNAEKWISSTLDSIINQTYNNIEVVIVDDGSTDNSLNVVNEYQSEKIKIIQQSNKGGCAARNLAFKESTGEYIVFFDADDLMFEEKIENQMKLVEKYGDEYIYSSQWIPFTNNQLPSKHPEKSPIDKDFDEAYKWLTTSWEHKAGAVGIWVTPRQLIEKSGNWDETLKVNQDGDFFCRVILNSRGVKFTENAYMFYRRDVNTSISKKNIPKRADSMLKSYMNYEIILNYNNSYETKKALAYNYIKFLYIYSNTYPKLANIAWQRINSLGVKENWIIGGKKFQLLCKAIGFKNALKLKKN